MSIRKILLTISVVSASLLPVSSFAWGGIEGAVSDYAQAVIENHFDGDNEAEQAAYRYHERVEQINFRCDRRASQIVSSSYGRSRKQQALTKLKHDCTWDIRAAKRDYQDRLERINRYQERRKSRVISNGIEDALDTAINNIFD